MQTSYTCGYCFWVGSGSDFEVDHILPLSRGGSDSIFNKQVICSGCNREKADRTREEYLLYRLLMGVKSNRGPIR